MNKDIEDLKTYATKLRADLMATNPVLQCMMRVLTPEQRLRVLSVMAELSVQQEQLAEKTQKSEAIALMQPAMERQYSALQGAHRLQLQAEASEG